MNVYDDTSLRGSLSKLIFEGDAVMHKWLQGASCIRLSEAVMHHYGSHRVN